jgi:membrane protein DedA with SNARE-associated domain
MILITELLNHLSQSPAPLVYMIIFLLLVVSGSGLPIAEELITVAAGVLIHQGVIDPLPTWILCYSGILIADWIVVWLGRHFGRAVLHRRWIKRILHPRRLLHAHHHVHEHGPWVVFVSRFVPGSRWATLLITGMAHLPRWKIFLADGLAAIISVSVQMAVGYFASALADRDLSARTWMTIGGIGLAAVLLGGYALWYRRFRRRTGRKPIRLGRFVHLKRPNARRGD